MNRMKWHSSMLAVATALSLVTASAAIAEDWADIEAAAKAEGTLVFYNAQSGWPQPVKAAEAFEQKYGIRVDMLSGLRGAELMEKVRVEISNGQDSGDIVMMGVTGLVPMVAQGLLQGYGEVPNTANLGLKPWFPEEVPVFSVTYGIVVNTNLVPESEEPKSWKDLYNEKWRGMLVTDEMTTPSSGQSWFAVMLDAFGEDYHRAMALQELNYDRAGPEQAKRVARGEFAIAFPFNMAELSSLEGLPLKGLIPGEGAPYTPVSVALIKDARHPNAAKLFMNYLLSEEGQAHFAKDGLAISTIGYEDMVPEDMRWRVFGKLLGHAIPEKQAERLKLAGEIYNRK